jgi:hypothetical protein
MKIYFRPLFAILLTLFSTGANSQTFEAVTRLKLEYWRAFDGTIAQEVIVTRKGEIALDSTVSPGMTEAERKQNEKQPCKR